MARVDSARARNKLPQGQTSLATSMKIPKNRFNLRLMNRPRTTRACTACMSSEVKPSEVKLSEGGMILVRMKRIFLSVFAALLACVPAAAQSAAQIHSNVMIQFVDAIVIEEQETPLWGGEMNDDSNTSSPDEEDGEHTSSKHTVTIKKGSAHLRRGAEF